MTWAGSMRAGRTAFTAAAMLMPAALSVVRGVRACARPAGDHPPNAFPP
jgi:hypothetical protein